MADVVTAPRILDHDTCMIYGSFFRLAGPVQIQRASDYPQKLALGQYKAGDHPFASYFSFLDTTGGCGLYEYQDPAKQGDRFWTSTCQTWKQQLITLPPLATAVANPSGETAAVTAIVHGHDDTIYVAFGANIYRLQSALTYSALLKALSVAPTGKAVVFNQRTFFPRGSGGYTYYDGAAWTDVNNQEAAHFTVWDGRLFLIESTTSTIKYSTTGNTGSWTQLTTALDMLADVPTGLFVYDDTASESVVHVATKRGPYAVDFTNAQALPLRLRLPRQTNAGKGPGVWRDSLFYPAGTSVYRYLAGDPATVEPVGLDLNDGIPSDQKGAIVDMAPDLSYLFWVLDSTSTSNNALVNGPAGMHAGAFGGFGAITTAPRSTGLSSIYLHDGRGNHTIFQSASTAQAATVGVVSDAYDANRLYFGADRTVYYIDLPRGLDNPLQDTTLVYGASCSHISSWFWHDNKGETKTALRLLLEIEGASANETVTVYYGTDGSSSWTQLTPVISANGSQTLVFGASEQGIAFRSIRIRVDLARGSTSTNRPAVRGLTLEYLPNLTSIRAFAVQLDCSQEFFDQTPQQQVDRIWTILGTATLGTFSFRDDEGDTRSYLVKAYRPIGEEYAGLVEGGKYTLQLVQFN